jgi:hypothetical protein
MNTYMYEHIYVYIYIYISNSPLQKQPVYKYVCMFIYRCIYMNIYMYEHIYVYIYTYLHAIACYRSNLLFRVGVGDMNIKLNM